MSLVNDTQQFRQEAHRMVDLIADYYENIIDYPVKSLVKPGDVLKHLPDTAPDNSESITRILEDFHQFIFPGLTHWQHPSFFAFFPANTSYPSIIGEMLTAALGQQGMIWETSPAAAELEEKMMEWLKELCGLPKHFSGVIQDTASASTLAALLTAREKASNNTYNLKGGISQYKFRIYCTSETHSSIEKAARIAGFGSENIVKVPVDNQFGMIPSELAIAIERDIREGFVPCAIVATIGTTGCTAVDPVKEIGLICQKHNVWLHVDAAYAGSAMVLPEMRHYIEGLDLADSYVFNPHKWMFTNFDCSAYFVKDSEALIKTFEILPEYLKTKSRGLVNDYRDWGVALGRRFRALKLWFVLRNFGKNEIIRRIRYHIEIAAWLTKQIENSDDFELMTDTRFSLVCFRFHPDNIADEEKINKLNEQLEHNLNNSGLMYITHTSLNKKYTLRLVVGQTNVEKSHVMQAWEKIREFAAQLA